MILPVGSTHYTFLCQQGDGMGESGTLLSYPRSQRYLRPISTTSGSVAFNLGTASITVAKSISSFFIVTITSLLAVQISRLWRRRQSW